MAGTGRAHIGVQRNHPLAQGHIPKRSDVNPSEGERKYGDVKYADPTNKKYPIDTPEHIHAALSYINMPKNASKYSPSAASAIKSRIESAARAHGIKVNGQGSAEDEGE